VPLKPHTPPYPTEESRFNHHCKGDERGVWFVYTLLAVITHFTSSRNANLLRCLQTLCGLSLSQYRFYIFMASSKLPWPRLWTTMWSLIPNPTTKRRLLLSLDDTINPKTGKKISAVRLCLSMLPIRLGLMVRYHRFKPSLSRPLRCYRKFLLLFLATIADRYR
jgi:hypothetical protein